jgi:predicted ATPase
LQSPKNGLQSSPIIRTPDQRLRVFISSTLKELAEERESAQQAVLSLRMNPVLYELGARPYPPRSLYQAYLAQSHVFIGIYWQQYGWVAPDMKISGLEDEFQLAVNVPKLIYVKKPAPEQDPKLTRLLQSVKNDARISYKYFSTAAELRELIVNDLALLLTERFELAHPSESRSADPPKSHNIIPRLPAPLVGREQDVQIVQNLLTRQDVRLVTLTGPGGVGKTSLALEAASLIAQEFPDGAFWIPLAAISEPELVTSAIARVLDVRERSGVPLQDSLKDYILGKSLLLLLDNFEQILPAGQVLATLLGSAHGLKLLVTSRARLNLRGEHEFPVHPLQLPDGSRSMSLEQTSQNPAVRLFVERTQATNPAFTLREEIVSDVVEIVRRLDGLPLALELAAARAKILEPHNILIRLETRFQLLAGGANDLPERQQTIRTTIDWSYNLLAHNLQVLFSQLSVFAGGFTHEAVENICEFDSDMDVLDGLSALLDNSLLRYETSARFSMLETIHEYARERLKESGEADRIHQRHALFFAGLARKAGYQVYSGEDEILLDRLEAEYDNFRQALAWLQAAPKFRPASWQLAIDLAWLCYRRGYLNEARRWFENAVEQSQTLGDEPLRGVLLSQAGAVAMWQSDLDTAVHLMDGGVAVLRKTGEPSMLSMALFTRGVLSINRSEPEQAEPLLEEALALFETLDQKWFQAMSHLHLGNVALSQGSISAATTYMQTALKLGKEVGARWIIASAINNFGEIARYQKQYDQAEKHYLESKRLFESVQSFPDVARALHSLGYVALAGGDQSRARSLFMQSLDLHQKLGVKRGVVEAVCGLSAALADAGQTELFIRLCGAVETQFNNLGGDLWPADRSEVERRVEKARQQLGEAVFTTALETGKGVRLEEALGLVISA